MKTIALLCALFIATGGVMGAGSVSTAPIGIVILWNGRDLSGWKPVLKDPAAGAQKAWSVKDGALHLAGTPAGYIRTEQSFANYHLHLEWRWPEKAGNSGVFVHVTGDDKVWPNAAQCQVKEQATGDLIGMNGFDFAKSVDSKGNKLVSKTEPPSEKPAGEWNNYDITCRGDTIELSVNGVLQNHVEKLTASSGFIALQMEGSAIEFRNLWLQPF